MRYTIFPKHIEKITSEEWTALWDDMTEEPNTDEEMLHFNFYEISELFDANDPGLITGYTTEKYLLELHQPEDVVCARYPVIKKLLNQKPAFYERWHSERHLTPKQIEKAMIQVEEL